MKYKFLKILLLLILCTDSIYLVYRFFSPSESLSKNTIVSDQVWSFKTDAPTITTPVLSNEDIIVRTNDAIFSLDKNSGRSRWEVLSKAYNELIDDAIPRKVAGNSKYLIAGERSNSLGIYSTVTGSSIWKMPTDLSFIAGLQVVDHLMIVLRHDDNLTVYDLDTKQRLWDIRVPPRTNLSVAANTNMIAFAADDFLQIYDLKTGELLKTTKYGDASTGELMLEGSTLYLTYAKAGGDWTVTSLQIDSLKENWNYHVGYITHPYLDLVGDQLYLYNETLIAIGKNTGKLLWKEDTQSSYSKPVAYGDHLYFISTKRINRNLCKAEISTGKLNNCIVIEKLGFFSSSDELVAPLVIDNMLIVSNNDGIAAYRIDE